MHRLLCLAGSAWLFTVIAAAAPRALPPAQRSIKTELFATADNCMACHNGLTTPAGEDVSIGIAWRATMMANSSRDPYWQAAVRREVMDHPAAAAEIEDECAICHMPMSHSAAHASGAAARVFANLGKAKAGDAESRLAQDGVSCALCHQITAKNFGTAASFSGGYVIDTTVPIEKRPLFGPYAPDPGLQAVMHSATGYQQVEGMHIRQSEMCATCHTLYTTARGPDGRPTGRFPEQVPFQEWQHSRYRTEKSCQACHMPAIEQASPIASVLGQPREGARRHTFVGGNFFVLDLLERFREDLGVEATPQELSNAKIGTLRHLQESSARLAIERATRDGGRLLVDVAVENLSGHKLPTAYPSRRAWLHVVVRDGSGRVVFESGALDPSGAIAGNDNDGNAAAFEPHHAQITRSDQVQIYESVLADSTGAVTTGLLKAIRYAKDNRLLPQGFDKRTAGPDIAVHGEARADPDFLGGSDRVRYVVDVPQAIGELSVEATLLFQPIGFRWAENLRGYKAAEPQRFLGYFETLAASSATWLARATATVTP
jgi:hypothetical protein